VLEPATHGRRVCQVLTDCGGEEPGRPRTTPLTTKNLAVRYQLASVARLSETKEKPQCSLAPASPKR